MDPTSNSPLDQSSQSHLDLQESIDGMIIIDSAGPTLHLESDDTRTIITDGTTWIVLDQEDPWRGYVTNPFREGPSLYEHRHWRITSRDRPNEHP